MPFSIFSCLIFPKVLLYFMVQNTSDIYKFERKNERVDNSTSKSTRSSTYLQPLLTDRKGYEFFFINFQKLYEKRNRSKQIRKTKYTVIFFLLWMQCRLRYQGKAIKWEEKWDATDGVAGRKRENENEMVLKLKMMEMKLKRKTLRASIKYKKKIG